MSRKETDPPVDGEDVGKPALQDRIRHRIYGDHDTLQEAWPTERIVRVSAAALAIVIPTIVMLWSTQFFTLVFVNNTPTGGDFGAHVWGPDYLRHEILPSGWYNGWSMDWYAGFPAYRFYMVVPALMVVFASFIMPYGVALKFVSVLGVITIPAMCWVFGRLANFRYPMPEVFAFAGLIFVLDDSWGIYGGNLKSTMAGEFSFSIALSLAILGLGWYAKGLETGKYWVRSAVILSLAAVSHGLVLIFVMIAAMVFSLIWVDKSRVRYIGYAGLATVALGAWWWLPFVANHAYMTDMKYTPEPTGASFDTFWDMYFPLPVPFDILVTSLAVFGVFVAFLRRQRSALGLWGVSMVLAFLVWATKRAVTLPLLWNPRLLPFFYLCRYLLMAYGAIELLTVILNMARNRRSLRLASLRADSVFAGVFSIVVLLVLGFMYQALPGGSIHKIEGEEGTRYSWGPIQSTETYSKAQGAGWAAYNFQGYEGRSAYPEYEAVLATMEDMGSEYGCGRAMWENHKDNGEYGTTMALMLLPYWTDGCIASMEGLFFEAAGTTPYHFLTAAAMSESSSNPVRGLRYVNNDATIGVRHLDDLGVHFVMLRSDKAKAEANERPELQQIAESGPWTIYLVGGSELVVPLDVQPVVVSGHGGGREGLLEVGTSWFQNPEEWAAMPADDGPSTWQRIQVQVDDSRSEIDEWGNKVKTEVVVPAETIKVVPQPSAVVSNVDLQEQSVSFDVDKVGVPIEVKVSYFPNWRVKGADGPYRVGPNMMVVVPTSNHVELSYGRSLLDYFALLMTLAGIGLCVYMWRLGDQRVTPFLFGAREAALEDSYEEQGDKALAAAFEAELQLMYYPGDGISGRSSNGHAGSAAVGRSTTNGEQPHVADVGAAEQEHSPDAETDPSDSDEAEPDAGTGADADTSEEPGTDTEQGEDRDVSETDDAMMPE